MPYSASLHDPRQAPRAAVIVPAYGIAQYLADALDSVRAQTLSDWECIVIDDGSPDDVASAVAPFLADPRFRFVHTANRGVSAARNRAVRESSAPLVTLLDGDDRLRPDYLATMVPLLERDPTIRLATCNGLMFGDLPREKLCVTAPQGRGDGVRGTLSEVLDRSFNVYIGSTFRRADLDAIGGFDEAMTHAEDLDLWIRLMLLGGEAYYVDAVLGDYRVRGGSASGSAELMLRGLLQVYGKARQALRDERPEVPIVERLMSECRAAIQVELAIDAVLAGDAELGVAQLRAAGLGHDGVVWPLSMAVWRVFPALARPMLRRRRNAHQRGAASKRKPRVTPGTAQ
jgi:hypothetical protein